MDRAVGTLTFEERSALVQELLTVNRMVTAEQLERWGLLEAATRLGLPSRVHSVHTQVTQASSLRDLRFVSAEERLLHRPERELKHWAGLSEVWWTTVLRRDAAWEVLDGRGSKKRRMPDARVSGMWWEPWAIEIDCGYDTQQIQRKLVGIAKAGFQRIVWATTVHDRVRRLGWLIDDLWVAGKLETVEEYKVQYCNFWSRQDPYHDRPRCFKRYECVGERQHILELACGGAERDPEEWPTGEHPADLDDDDDGSPWVWRYEEGE